MTGALDFTDFMSRRLEASTAFVEGRVEPLLALSTQVSPATLFGPRGDVVDGADAVNAANRAGAAMFGPSATNAFEVAHQAASGDLAYWTGVQRSTVQMSGQDDPVRFDLRVTEIFRREGDGWMLVHRHADPLADAAKS